MEEAPHRTLGMVVLSPVPTHKPKGWLAAVLGHAIVLAKVSLIGKRFVR